MEIDFFTFVDDNTVPYADFLYEISNSLISTKHNIHWNCIPLEKLNKFPKYFSAVDEISPLWNNNLFFHGAGINRAMFLAVSEYVVIADADICILYKNWDELIIDKLKQVDCFGFGNNEKDIFQRIVSIPLPTFFCAKKSIFRKFNFIPVLRNEKSLERKKVLTDKDEKITGLKKGKTIKCDTGYKVAEVVYKENLKCEMMKNVFGVSEKRKLPLPDKIEEKLKCIEVMKTQPDRMMEWHYNNELFGTHFSRSRDRKFDGEECRIWENRIKKYLSNDKTFSRFEIMDV